MLLFSLFSASLAALEVHDLYQANVIVDSQNKQQREQAIEKALAAVFLKVGGKQSALTHNVLQTAQKDANGYVSQYRYQRNDDQLSLVVSFNEAKVNQLFKDADLSLWGSLRPQVLLWLIDEQGTSRTIIASDADSVVPVTVNEFSIQRGLPIVMPLMDLTDSEQVILNDFWHYSHEQVQQASLRYFADTVVVMRVSDSSLVHAEGQPTLDTSSDIACGLLCQQQAVVDQPKVLDWKVYTQGALYTQQYQGVDKVSLITQGLSDITELIYQSYALSTTAENDFVIEVQNITSLKSDTEVANFLINLSAVKAVTLINAQGDVRRFKLDLIGSKASFIASLKLNNKLTQLIKAEIEPQIESQDSALNSMILSAENDVADGFTNTNTNTSTNNIKKMKVIVLGDNNSATKNVDDKINEDIINSADKSKPLNTYTDLTPEAKEHFLPGHEISEHEAQSHEQALHEKIVPLIIVPNIPVFYWEQG